MPNGYAPLYFASAVLPDGRVVMIGGEYQAFEPAWTNAGRGLRSGREQLDPARAARRLDDDRRRAEHRARGRSLRARGLLHDRHGGPRSGDADVDDDHERRQGRHLRRGRLDAAAERQRADGRLEQPHGADQLRDLYAARRASRRRLGERRRDERRDRGPRLVGGRPRADPPRQHRVPVGRDGTHRDL